jgi:hypothetical protein
MRNFLRKLMGKNPVYRVKANSDWYPSDRLIRTWQRNNYISYTEIHHTRSKPTYWKV